MSSNTNLSYKRAVRILTGACGLLFSAFSFIYLYLFQGDVLGALHYSLSQGKTHYSPLAGAIIITLVLLIFRWGINGLLGLKGSVRSLSYFPSCLLLGVLTFEYPQYYGSDGLLFSSSSQVTLRLDADSLYNYLGAKPYTAESTTDFLARICRDEVGKHTALDYYLSALLLDKKLDKFASVVEDSFFEQDTLPRYYREAIMLYKQSHPAYPRVLNDTLMIQRLQEFDKLQKEYTSPVEQKNRMRREFGDTYWWYYRYQ